MVLLGFMRTLSDTPVSINRFALENADLSSYRLTENIPDDKAASVWDLLQRDFALEWAVVNADFVH